MGAGNSINGQITMHPIEFLYATRSPGSTVNTDQLIAFERIVREGSFSRAAWSLEVSQPTVSARIRTLERAVGGRLFDRTRRDVTLTARGQAFLPYARQAIAALQAGIDHATLAHAGEQGELTIGMLRSLTGHFLTPALAQFQQQHPEVRMVVREGDHWQIVEWLKDGDIELGMVTWPDLGPSLVALTPLFVMHEQAVLLAAGTHPLTALDVVTRADVARLGDPFMLLRWWQVTPEPIVALSQEATRVADLPIDTARDLLASGVGVGFFPQAQVVPDVERRTVVAIDVVDLPPIVRTSALVRPQRNVTLSASAQRFAETLEQRAGALGLLTHA